MPEVEPVKVECARVGLHETERVTGLGLEVDAGDVEVDAGVEGGQPVAEGGAALPQ